MASDYQDLQAARIVAGTLTLLSREIREVGRPVDLWSPPIYPEFIRDIAAEVSRGEADALWVEDRHPARGLAVFRPSPWESNFFGFTCARLLGPFMVVEDQRDREARVASLARQAAGLGLSRNIKLITIKTFHDPAVLRGFLSEGFVLAEIGASLRGLVPEEELEIALPSGFMFVDGEDLPALADEVVAALGDFFYDGHYRHDPVPGPEEARRLWSLMVADDLNGAADPAVVLWDRKKDRPAGLATVRTSDRAAGLSIMAVCPRYQGQGLGRLILAEILNRLIGKAGDLRVETASYNLPALKLYQGLGFVPAAPLVSLHRHLATFKNSHLRY